MQKAWHELRDTADYADVEFLFMSAPYEDFLVTDGVVETIPQRSAALAISRQLTKIVLEDMDAIIISSAVRFKDVMSVYEAHRAESHANATGDPQWVSDECFETAVSEVMRAHRSWRVAAKVRAATLKPVALTTEPLYKASMIDFPRYRSTIGAVRTTGDEAALMASWKAGIRRLAGTDFTLLEQPDETLDSPAFTKEEYSIGTYMPRNRSVPMQDWNHMTPAFGALIVHQCVTWAREVSAATAEAAT